MTINVSGWAAFEPKGPLKKYNYELPSTPEELGPFGVLLEVLSCSLCHSDLHMIDNDWDITKYPIVPGHEIVGKIVCKGAKVALNVHDVVGVGWLASSCGSCDACTLGMEPQCPKAHPTILNPHFGGISSHVFVEEKFAYNLNFEDPTRVAPLLCAGATVWTPLSMHLTPGLNVGVIGLGGLGASAIQLADSLGHSVFCLTRGSAKKKDALLLGADDAIDMTSDNEVVGIVNSLDLILNTSSAPLDYDKYMSCLAPGGKFILLGLPGEESKITIDSRSMVFKSTSISGSLIAGSRHMKELLRFAAINHIEPMVEMMQFSQINEALSRLKEGNVRYRIVLTPD
ncbi:hypothetical protein GEMRC1_007688 [Eukaryota sp. GEM-RC1]